MKRWLLAITFIISTLFSADVNLSIDNFVDNGDGTATFDILMTNSQEVGGFQFNIVSGDGMFDDADNGSCKCVGNSIPNGCGECYFDLGLDGIKNAYEPGYNSDDDDNQCSTSGECTDPSLTSSNNCTESGTCSNDSLVDKGTCEDAGVCSNVDDTNQCDCLYNNASWTSDENYWTPDNLWSSNSTPAVCIENDYVWEYRNEDPHGDNYADPNSDDDGPYCTISGECSQVEGLCISDGTNIGNPGDVLDWPSSCCNVTQGGVWHSPHRDESDCEDLGFTWTAHNNENTCESIGGWWIGSENGTDGDGNYNTGEKFFDASTDIVYTMPLTNFTSSGGFFAISYNNGLVLGAAFGGGSYPISEDPQILLSGATLDISALSEGSYEISVNDICERVGFNCPSQLIIPDAVGNELVSEFSTFIVNKSASGLSGQDATIGDGICSETMGENFETESVCESVCGDGYCDLDTSEDFSSCAADCESDCDDGFCYWAFGEDNDSCASDCPLFGCGDYVCSNGEDYSNCATDCGNGCGDGECSQGESDVNCPSDCNEGCGDGKCMDGVENYINCDLDCDSYCGDGIYDYAGGENETTCVEDYTVTCGDGYYDYNEGEDETCVEDYTVTCGDGYYDYTAGENETCVNDYVLTDGDGYCDQTGCPEECAEDPSDQDCPSECGDGFYHHVGLGGIEGEECEDFEITCTDQICSDLEFYFTCPADCVSYVGDGYCHDNADGIGTETPENAASDCDPVCGDEVCAVFNTNDWEILETFVEGIGAYCQVDCTSCGDGVCSPEFYETCATCPDDCNVDCECDEGESNDPIGYCCEDGATDACNYCPEAGFNNICIGMMDDGICDGTFSGPSFDCAGECGGSTVVDCAGVCDGSSVVDCGGECGGELAVDECGVCGGDDSTCSDCAGVPNGNNVVDECGTCNADPSNDCVQDCAGEWGGTALLDDCTVPICSDGTTGLISNASCTDCNEDVNGIAELDGCGDCVGGNTGLEACPTDCMGVDGGSAYFDDCGACVEIPDENCMLGCDGNFANDGTHLLEDECNICAGDNSTCSDCAGVPNGNNVVDECGTCNADPSNDCVQDCAGEWGGTAVDDDCGVCGGDNSTCLDCAGVPNGDSVLDNCDVCVSLEDETCLLACDGNFYNDGSEPILDECGVCGGDGLIMYCIDSDNDGLGAGDGELSCDAPEDGWVPDCSDAEPDCATNDMDACGECGGIETDPENCLGINDLSPKNYMLSDNYPNPFNPVTSIEYSVEKAGYVSISIYNVMGHKLYDLVNGYHSPGVRYSAVWNSNTQSDIPVSTGIYFYEMKSGNYTERKKMVLVK